MNKQGTGGFHTGFSMFHQALMPLLSAREYTLSDKYGYLSGSLFMLKTPANAAQFTTNLTETLAEIDIPIYFLHGAHDRQVSYELAQSYFETLNAPKKEFYTFDHSAHNPHMEEPQEFIQVIKGIMATP
jgi:pimeloyl-ACP methyl ester carboxylesterase